MSQNNSVPSRTRTIYATINRYRGRAPSISLKPVTFSLTEGTDIPPPTDTPPKVETPPPPMPQPTAKTPQPTIDTNVEQDPSLVGPLSSHPVTPVETPPAEVVNPTPFRIPRKSLPNGHNRQPTTSTSSSDYTQRQIPSSETQLPYRQQTPGQFQQQDMYQPQRPSTSGPLYNSAPYQTASSETPRRPSFIERFFRLRSRGSRSSVSSGQRESSLLGLKRTASQPLDYGERGAKRTASPGSNAASSRNPDGNANGAATLPRSVRKRSMELLSNTGRRMSGMWSRQEVHSMMDLDRQDTSMSTKEARRQRELEMEWAREEQLRQEREAEILAQPPPKIQGLDRRLDGGQVGGEELFMNIGKS